MARIYENSPKKLVELINLPSSTSAVWRGSRVGSGPRTYPVDRDGHHHMRLVKACITRKKTAQRLIDHVRKHGIRGRSRSESGGTHGPFARRQGMIVVEGGYNAVRTSMDLPILAGNHPHSPKRAQPDGPDATSGGSDPRDIIEVC